MFVAHDVEFGVPYGAARPRLMDMMTGDALVSASRAAYDEGLAHRADGSLPSPARLMRVRSLHPAQSVDRVMAGLRWEASGLSAGLFPVLDADIVLAPAGHRGSRLALAGVYRAPFGYLRDGLGPAAAGQVADTTVRALLRAVASYLGGTDSGWPAGTSSRPAEAP